MDSSVEEHTPTGTDLTIIKPGLTGRCGYPLRNRGLDDKEWFEWDWVMFLDDDNVMHPDFAKSWPWLSRIDAALVTWGQEGRLAATLKPEFGNIDMASYMFRPALLDGLRFEMAPGSDGRFAQAASKRGVVASIAKDLCYYNRIRGARTEDITGWFNHPKTYDRLIAATPEGGTIVEIGAWMGKSSSYLCDRAQKMNVHVVDTWRGTPSQVAGPQKIATETDLYRIFLNNMGMRKFTAHRLSSVKASMLFSEESVDAVFIDAGHSYDECSDDIAVWLPKVKPGGIISGDDYSPAFPGVVKAVDEMFPNAEKLEDCWIYQKPCN
jgi:hypothetical protein